MKKLVFLIFALVGISLSAQENIDWNLTGAGSRAIGMGGAFIGVADDATALTWNPAGLYQLERTEASIAAQYFLDTYRYEYKDLDYEFEHENNLFAMNFASIAFPLKFNNFKFTTALVMQRQLEIFNYDEYEDGYYEEKGSANTLSIGGGTRFANIFAVGFAVNKWYGTYKQEYKELNYPDDSYTDKSKFSGLNFGLGTMLDLNYLQSPVPLKLGVSIKTPFDLELKYDYGSLFIEMPMMLGFGASLRLGENFTLAADFETRAYKDKKILAKSEGYETEEIGIISFTDLNQFRIGAEYLLVSDFAVLPLRIGFQNVPTTDYSELHFADGFFEKAGEQLVGTGFSIGTGLIFERFALDFYTFYSLVEAEKTDFYHDANFQYRYNYSIEKLKFGISGIIYF